METGFFKIKQEGVSGYTYIDVYSISSASFFTSECRIYLNDGECTNIVVRDNDSIEKIINYLEKNTI